MKKFIEDFKAFALKGNILDMAVGVVIGGAFGKIVSSLVADIITPLISLATGSLNFTDLKWVFKAAVVEGGEVITPEVAMTYGNFLQAIIDFLIIALSIFIVLRIIMNAEKKLASLKKKEEEAEEAAEEIAQDTEISLLTEIRDMLKDQKAE
ncbi:MAG: large-conductance mechanosensitive channel protein MscL [Clostridia bacterium]|nr:large-conductance mechanosensitive channel protein MscL [Clostridia bacterium]